MEGGSELESAPPPNAPTSATSSVAVSIRKSLIVLCIELRVELKAACMHHPPKGLDYHHRRASRSVERGRARRRSVCPAHGRGINSPHGRGGGVGGGGGRGGGGLQQGKISAPPFRPGRGKP